MWYKSPHYIASKLGEGVKASSRLCPADPGEGSKGQTHTIRVEIVYPEETVVGDIGISPAFLGKGWTMSSSFSPMT